MTTQYTPTLKLALPVTGELSGTWGDVVNDNITSMIEQAIAGLATINSWTGNAHTLTTANGTTSESRCAMLVAATGGGAPSAAAEIICPAAAKLYVLQNNTSYAVTLKTSAGTGVAVAAGDTAFLFCDGTNVNSCVTTIVNGHITGNLTVDGNATINGNTTLGNATSDTVTVTARVASNVLPSADNTYDLGSTGNSWKDLYIDGTATMALVAISGGTINGVSIGATTPATFLAVDNLSLDGNTIASTNTNGNIVIAPNGTGDVQLDADTVRVGDSGAAVTVTSNGAGALTVTTGGAADLTLSTNSGATTGTITIANGANGNITLTPDGTGDVILSADRVQIGDANTDATLTTNGTGNLNLSTNNGTNSGTIQIAQGANGNITLTPNGTGSVSISKLYSSGNTTLGATSANTLSVAATITSNLIFTDNTYDIGASGATRPRNLYLAGDATIGGSIAATTLDLTNLEVTNIKAKDGTASITLADSTGVASFTANPVLSGGTANGVMYLNGSKVVTTGSALTYNGTTLTAVNNASANSITLSRTTAVARDWGLGVDGDGGFRLTDVTGSAVILSALPSGVAYLASESELVFKYNTSTEGMRLTSTGLGIGTSSPAVKLQVAGDGRFTGTSPTITLLRTDSVSPAARIRMVGSDNADKWEISTNYLVGGAGLEFDYAGSNLAFLSTSGNLGIGTGSPATRLDVVNSGVTTATVRTSSTTGSRDAKFRLNVPSAGGDDPAGQIEFTYDTGYTVAGSIQMTSTPSNMKFFIGASEQMRLNSTGLGVGLSPTYKLDVSSSAEVVGRFARSAGSNALLLIQDPTTTTAPYIASYGDVMAFGRYGGGESMRITSTGSVAIGDNSAGSKLFVRSDSSDTTFTDQYNVATGSGIIIQNESSTTGTWAALTAVSRNSSAVLQYASMMSVSAGSGYSPNMVFVMSDSATTSVERMRITSAGYVGIGTNSPGRLLTVDGGSADAYLKLNTTSTSGSIASGILFTNTTNSDGYIMIRVNGNSNDLTFYTGNSERMRILSGGAVCVGTTTAPAGASLSVLPSLAVKSNNSVAGKLTTAYQQFVNAGATVYVRLQQNGTCYFCVEVTISGDYGNINAGGAYKKALAGGANDSSTTLFGYGDTVMYNLGNTSSVFSIGSATKPNNTTIYVPVTNNSAYGVSLYMTVEVYGQISALNSVDFI